MIMRYFFSLNRKRGGNYPGLFEFSKIPRPTSKLSESPGNFWKFSALARNFPEHDFQNYTGLKKFQNFSQNTSKFGEGLVINLFFPCCKCLLFPCKVSYDVSVHVCSVTTMPTSNRFC